MFLRGDRSQLGEGRNRNWDRSTPICLVQGSPVTRLVRSDHDNNDTNVICTGLLYNFNRLFHGHAHGQAIRPQICWGNSYAADMTTGINDLHATYSMEPYSKRILLLFKTTPSRHSSISSSRVGNKSCGIRGTAPLAHRFPARHACTSQHMSTAGRAVKVATYPA